MSNFNEIKDRISLLGRAEYRYDRLVSEFAEHYLALVEAKYETLPDLDVFRTWLKHWHVGIRPALLMAWQEMANRFAFQLGDHITVNESQLYVVRMSCYPLENIVRLTGFGLKKDGKPSQASVDVTIQETSVVHKSGRCLDKAVVELLFFEGSTRIVNVRDFILSEIARLT